MAINQVQVGAPSSSSNADGATPYQLGGKAAEGIVAELHGKWYTAAYRGRVFHGASAAAGVTLARDSTTSTTFLLANPLGSGVNVELISADLGMLGTTSVVATVGLACNVQTPTALTAITLTVGPGLIGGGGVNQAKLYSSATITAITVLWPMFQIQTTADTADSNHYDFDGKLILGQGAVAHYWSNPVQTQAMVPALDWAEWPL